MKVMQILDGFCYWDATETVGTLEHSAELFSPEIVFVEAPDYVFQGWAYDETQSGDDRFIRPIPPEGWLYDDKTGTFYKETDVAPSESQDDEPITQRDLIGFLLNGINQV